MGFQMLEGDDDWSEHGPTGDLLRAMAGQVLDGVPLDTAFKAQPPTLDSQGRPVTAKAVRYALQRPITAGIMLAPDGSELGVMMAEPILDLDTYRDLVALFTDRKVGKPTQAAYPLGPVLACGKCGNQLTGSMVYPPGKPKAKGGTPVAYYRCATPHKLTGHDKPCRGVSIKADDLHKWIWASVEGWAEGSDRYQAAAAKLAGLSDQRQQLEAELAKRQGWVSGAYVKLTNDLIDQATYDLVETQQGAKIRQLQVDIKALGEAMARPQPVTLDWPNLGSAEQCSLVADAFQTPIMVAPSPGGPKAPGVEARVALVLREAQAA